MLPEDSVLVGVINRKRDFTYARDQHWYRIPQARMPRGVTADYLAFFLSGSSFGDKSGAIHYFARNTGLELHYRYELIPNQPDHKRANDVYYRVALGDLQPKVPPVVNADKRVVTFIYTTWDRFVNATEIADLYSPDDYFVDRLYYALHARGIEGARTWSAERRTDDSAPSIRILCDNGDTFVASPIPGVGSYFMDRRDSEDAILQAVLERIASNGGPAMVSLPPGE